MSILGIDHGNKHIGLAISEDSRTAYGLSTITYSSLKEVFAKIKQICQEYQVKEIIIGLPLDSNGKAGSQAQKVQKFALLLKKRTGIKIKYQDETLSSFEAGQKMTAVGLSRKKSKAIENALAAQIILQEYLDNLKLENS